MRFLQARRYTTKNFQIHRFDGYSVFEKSFVSQSVLNPLSVLFHFENVHLLNYFRAVTTTAHFTRCTFLFILSKFFLYVFFFMS